MWCGNVALGASFGGPESMKGVSAMKFAVAVVAVAISACIAFVLPSVLVARPQAGSASLYIISGAGGAMVASYGDLAACTEAMNSAQERSLSGLPPPASLICVSNK
jgi:hypothetical protein